MISSLTKVATTPSGAAHPLPPVTQGWPLIGALPALLQQQATFLTNARQQYGDVYTLDLGLMKAIMLNNPAHVQYVLRDGARNYAKGAAWIRYCVRSLATACPLAMATSGCASVACCNRSSTANG